jgi:hypothetical protein
MSGRVGPQGQLEARHSPTARLAHPARLCSNDVRRTLLQRQRGRRPFFDGDAAPGDADLVERRPAAAPGRDTDSAGLQRPRRKREQSARGLLWRRRRLAWCLAVAEEEEAGSAPGCGGRGGVRLGAMSYNTLKFHH